MFMSRFQGYFPESEDTVEDLPEYTDDDYDAVHGYDSEPDIDESQEWEDLPYGSDNEPNDYDWDIDPEY